MSSQRPSAGGQRQDDADLLLEVALRFGAELDLGALLDEVLQRFSSLCRTERAMFALVEPGPGPARDRLSAVHRHNLRWPSDDEATSATSNEGAPVSLTVIEQVLESRNLIVVPDTAEDEDYRDRQSVRALQLRYLIGVPVELQDGAVGVLYADSKVEAGAGWEPPLQLLRALGRLVATAVENARLFASERFRGRLLAEMVHGLRSPLSVLAVNAEALQKGSLPPAEQTGAVDDICATTTSMARTIDNALDVFRNEAQRSAPEASVFDLGALLEEHLEAYRRWASVRRLGLRLEAPSGLPPVTSSAERVLLVVDNLLSNAIKYADPETDVVVVLRAASSGQEWARIQRDAASPYGRAPALRPDPDQGFVEIVVESRGVIILPELAEELFEAWTQAEEGAASSGLGLAIAAQCVLGLGGRIGLRQPEPSVTRIAFSLPVALAP